MSSRSLTKTAPAGFLSATTSLKFTQVMCTAFSIGMLFFPLKMMEGYKADTFSGSSQVMFCWAMGIFGTQQLLVGIISAAIKRDGVPTAAKSVACLCNAVMWIFFAINDLSYVLAGALPESMPADSIYANCGVLALFGAISFAGWKASGSVTPNFGAFHPQGRTQVPLLVAIANLLFFGVALAFFASDFMELQAPGVLSSLPGAMVKVKGKMVPAGPTEGPLPIILLILGNAGKCMLANCLSTLAICSVADEDTSYRLLRGWCLLQFFFLGTFARDGVLLVATGWPSPMRLFTFVQCFGVAFYMTDKMVGMPYKLTTKI